MRLKKAKKTRDFPERENGNRRLTGRGTRLLRGFFIFVPDFP
jgi:hypothetical protein